MTTTNPKWLPAPLSYEAYCGDWNKFIDEVYQIFQRDFIHSRPVYEKLPVVFDSRIIDGREAGFWHIVQTEDTTVGERVPDLRRCERIPWPKPTIEHPSDSAISVWKDERKKPGSPRQTRVLIWLENLDYLVVLREKSNIMILITAYCVVYESHREKLRKERDLFKTKDAP